MNITTAQRTTIGANPMKRTILILTVAAITAWSYSALAANLASAAPTFKTIGKPDSTLAVSLRAGSSQRIWLTGHAANLRVSDVKINGHNPQVAEVATSTEYGFGVAIRYFQTGERFYVRLANVGGRAARVVIHYRVN